MNAETIIENMTEAHKEALCSLFLGKSDIEWKQVSEILGVEKPESVFSGQDLVLACGLSFCCVCGLIFKSEEQYLFNGTSMCLEHYKEWNNSAPLHQALSAYPEHHTFFNRILQSDEVLTVHSLVLCGKGECTKSLEQISNKDVDFDIEEIAYDDKSCLLRNMWLGGNPCGWREEGLEINYWTEFRVEFESGAILFEDMSTNVMQFIVESRGVFYSYVAKKELPQ